MSTKEKINQYLNTKGISPTKAEGMLNWGKGALTKSSSISTDKLEEFLLLFNDLSSEWLLRGKGEMIKSTGLPSQSPQIVEKVITKTSIPYYKSLPVSAGQLDTIIQEAEPDGYIDLSGVTAKALFPVVGCSMKPEINPGDIIGISPLESWDIVDPDKVYLVITSDDRMIKHLSVDEMDDSILWCLSPNYPKFKIYKSDIKRIYRVTFCGKLI